MVLDETHQLDKAAEAVGKDISWANAFFKRPKIQEWMSYIAKQQAAVSGMTIGWIRAEMMSVYLGYKLFWEGECSLCHVKQKSWVEPEDDSTLPCLACQTPVQMQEIREPIKKDRQQALMLQEMANRIDPKIERVQHEFSSEQFHFKAQED